MKRAVLLLSLLLAVGCISTGKLSQMTPPSTPCTTDPELVGTWRAAAVGQLGPGLVYMTFHCDCTYSTKGLLIFLGMHGRGYYRVQGDHLLLTERFETEDHPYRIRDGSLSVQVNDKEAEKYARVSRRTCPSPGAIVPGR